MGSHGGVAPRRHRTRRETCSEYNNETLSHLPVSFSPSAISLSCCPRSITIVCPPIRFSSPSYAVFSTVTPAFTFQFVSFTSRDGSRTHGRGLPTHGRGEWLGFRCL